MEIATDDHAAVLLRFDDGARGAFHVSQVTAGRKNRLTIEIAGSGRPSPGIANRPTGSGSGRDAAPIRSWSATRRCSVRPPASISHYPGGHAEGFPDTFKQLYADVYGWIVEGRTPVGLRRSPPSRTADQELRLCEAIAQAPPTGRWVGTVEP